jgi:hypothetical protein
MDMPVTFSLPDRISTLFSFRTFQVMLLALSGCAVALSCVQVVHFLPVTSENIYPESSGVLSALRWSQGLPLYQDFRQPPYLTTPFPPLWYALTAQVAKLGATDLDSLTQFGRLLALVCLLGIAGLAYLWNRRLGFSRLLSVLAPAFFLSVPILVPWAVTARPDLLALLLSFLAVYVAATEGGLTSVGAASILASFAFLSRHNSVAAPVAIVLWLASCRRWRPALLFCVLWAFIVGPVLIAFQISSGGFLFLNLSGGKFGQLSLSYSRDVLARLFEPQGHAFAIALFGFGVYGFFEALRRGDVRLRLLTLYAFVAFGVAVLSSAAAGSAPNHFLEAALAFAALIPVGLASLELSWSNGAPSSVLAMVLVFVFLVPSLDVQRSNVVHNRADDLRPLIPLIVNRRVFTDIPYVAARATPPESLDLASLLNSERGRRGWSSAAVVRDLSDKRYSLVILSQPIEEAYLPAGLYPRYPRMDAAMQAAISENYSLCSRLANAYIYAPLSSERSSPICPLRTEETRRVVVGLAP